MRTSELTLISDRNLWTASWRGWPSSDFFVAGVLGEEKEPLNLDESFRSILGFDFDSDGRLTSTVGPLLYALDS